MKPDHSVRQAYDAWAPAYDHDRNLTRDLDAQVLRTAFADHASRLALEIGCGTGKNTGFLAQHSRAVLALDFSTGMLHQAQANVTARNVRFIRADLRQPWPLPAGCVDWIVCDLVLEHMRDLGLIFAEAARRLRPGGLFYAAELHPVRQALGSKARFQGADGLTEIAAFVHPVPDFLRAGRESGLLLERQGEHWHAEDDKDAPPRLLTLHFRRAPGAAA